MFCAVKKVFNPTVRLEGDGRALSVKQGTGRSATQTRRAFPTHRSHSSNECSGMRELMQFAGEVRVIFFIDLRVASQLASCFSQFSAEQ